MERHTQINNFSLAAHRLAVERLREQPQRLGEALEVLRRWQQQAEGPTHCTPYWDEWAALLHQGVDAVATAVCSLSDHAEVLRSVSPLGRFISAAERRQFLSEARQTA